MLTEQTQNLIALCQQRKERKSKHACSSVSCLGLPLLLRRSCSWLHACDDVWVSREGEAVERLQGVQG